MKHATISKAALAILMIFMVLLSACGNNTGKNAGNNESASEKVEITFANWLGSQANTSEIFKKLLEDFQDAHPNITVTPLDIPFNQYKNQILVSSAGGKGPDLMMSNQAFTTAFVGAGIARSLDGLIDDNIINDLYEGNREGVTFNNMVMAMPWVVKPFVLYYNKTLFKQAELDPNAPPKTWAEMIAAAEKITAMKTDNSGQPLYGLGLASSAVSASANNTYLALLSYGGKFVDSEGRLVLDQGEALKQTLDFIKQMANNNITPVGNDYKTLRSMFGAGTLGMYMDHDAGVSAVTAASGKGEEFHKEFGLTTIPVNMTGRSESVSNQQDLLIAKDTDTKKAEAASKLIEYLVSKETMIKYHKSNGVLSSRSSIADLPEMSESEFTKMFIQQLNTASTFPNSNPKFDNAMTNLAQMVQLVTAGDADSEDAIKKNMPKIKDLYVE